MSVGQRAAARFTVFRPDSPSMTEGMIPCLARLSPRQSRSHDADWARAASVLNRQLKLTGSEKSSQYPPEMPSIATSIPSIPKSPQGIEPDRRGLSDGVRRGTNGNCPRERKVAELMLEEMGTRRSLTFRAPNLDRQGLDLDRACLRNSDSVVSKEWREVCRPSDGRVGPHL